MSKKQLLRVFICHSSQDKPKVRGLYRRLQEFGVEPWLDEENLIPGQKWELEIPKAVKEAHVVLICLSNNSINKEGYVQKEIKFALDSADEKPENTIFLIPVRFENCEVPERFKKLQWVDLFDPKQYAEKFFKLQQALEIRAKEVGATIQPPDLHMNKPKLINSAKLTDFGKLFFSSKSILCPYCLAEIRFRNDIANCPKCKSELPPQYVKASSDVAPMFVQIIGDSYSGKTVYLQTLYLMLTRLGKIWSDYNSKVLSDSLSNISFQKDALQFVLEQELPPPTPLEYHEPLIVLLEDMEPWENRTLIIRDSSGELLQNLHSSPSNLSYLLHTPTTFFIINLSDIANTNNPNRISDMLLRYIETCKSKGVVLEHKTIIVIFSKADLMKNSLPDEIKEYLLNDPLKGLVDNSVTSASLRPDYVNNISIQSNRILDWFLNTVPSGTMFVYLAKMQGINLHFSMVSALGREAPRDYISISPKPIRVLDPLFLSLELNSRD